MWVSVIVCSFCVVADVVTTEEATDCEVDVVDGVVEEGVVALGDEDVGD